jgi:hypothetical protein
MRTEKTKTGMLLFPAITIKVFNVGNHGCTMKRLRAAPGHMMSEKILERLLEAAAEDLEKRFPDDEWEAVDVGIGAVNLVWRGKRQASGMVRAAEGS